MKVILLQDVRPHGKKGDLVEVSDGYARNVLIKKKQAMEATKKNINDWKLKQANQKKVAEENLAAAQELAKEIEGWKVETQIKAGENGKTFGSVSSKEIAVAIKEQYGKDIDKKKIIIDEPIRSLGTHEIVLKLHPQVSAKLDVHVGEL